MSYKFLLISFLALAACAPKPDASPEPQIQFEFGPRQQDVNLDLSHLNEQTQASKNNWPQAGAMTAQEKLNFVENILAVGRQFQISSLKDSAIRGVRQFRQTYQSQSLPFENSPYVEAIVGSTQKEARDQVSKAQAFLPVDAQKLNQILVHSEKTYPWTPGPLSSAASIKMVEEYVQAFLRQLPSLNLNPAVVDTLNLEVPVRTEKTVQLLQGELSKVKATKNSAEMVLQLQRMGQAMSYNLPAETKDLLKKGGALAHAVLGAADEQDILSCIVEIYKMLDSQDRQTLIGSESQALLDFLNSSDQYRLECLETRGCKRDPMAWGAKGLKIFPEIRKMGVANIRTKMDSGMRGYILQRLDTEIYDAVKTVPSMMAEQINQGIQDQLAQLGQIKNDYAGFAKKMAKSWSSLRLASAHGQVRGLEQSQIASVNAPVNGQSSSTLLGQGLLVKTLILNSESDRLSEEEKIEWSLEHLNKLLALGGYKKNETEAIRPLTQPIDMKFGDFKMSLQEILKSNFSFAVPDQISLTSAYGSTLTAPVGFNVSVVGQARLLRGFSQSMNFLKDWQATAFDPILGKETVSQAFATAPASVASRKMFPKDSLFALSVGNAAVILKNLLKELSPVFVVGQASQIIWANDFNLSDSDAASMAGVVNLIAGQRDLKVAALDISEYMVALGDFVQALQGIEQTQSSFLLSHDSGAKNGVEELLQAQHQIKLLVVGLGNFLSNKMVAEDGWVHEVYSLRQKQIESGEMKIMTQFKTIEALLRAYEMTQVTPYLWSAMDMYYKLNKEAFDMQKGFYRGVESLQQGLEVIKILKQLQPHLPSASQNQLNRLLNSWTTLAQTRLS
jgi:hypothetical protein